MDNDQLERVPARSEVLRAELRRLDWAKGLNEESLTAIFEKAEFVELHAGAVVIEVDSETTQVWFLITGRLHAWLYDSLGKEVQKDTLARGAVIGLFSLGLSE